MWWPRVLPWLALFVMAGCVYHPRVEAALYDRSVQNRAHVDGLALGQSIQQVRGIMGPPQRREAVRTVRGDEEIWGYLVDYHHSRMETVTFVDGKVIEIREEPWTEHH